ncbi:MAG: ammonia channel protein, partial [Betaproteobacteria bacterium]
MIKKIFALIALCGVIGLCVPSFADEAAAPAAAPAAGAVAPATAPAAAPAAEAPKMDTGSTAWMITAS